MRVELVYALPDRAWRVSVEVAEVATVADALAAGLPLLQAARGEAAIDMDVERLAVYGRPVTPQSRLHVGDRIELLRPLLADPKQARRRRAEQTRRR